MKTLILCGGLGTRAYPHTADLPKPLLEIGGQPMLRHVMEIYASQGLTDFVLAAGFRLELIEAFAEQLPSSWDATVVDTGLGSATGRRVELCREVLSDPFFLTYGDGLADVDLRDLLGFHGAHPGAATVTVVPLPSPYGTVDFGRDDRVQRFVEKPRLLDRWINGGFFCMDIRVFDLWSGDDLEREVLPTLAAGGELRAYRHGGFWKSMDTYKDALELTSLSSSAHDGRPPWIRSATSASS